MSRVETWIAECGCQHLLGPECPCNPSEREDAQGPYWYHNDTCTDERVEVRVNG